MVSRGLGHGNVPNGHRKLYIRYVGLIATEYRKPSPDKGKIARWSELGGKHLGMVN